MCGVKSKKIIVVAKSLGGGGIISASVSKNKHVMVFLCLEKCVMKR